MMTDEELAKFLGIPWGNENRAKIMAAFTTKERADWEELKKVEDQLRLYLAGKGPKPTGICRDRRKRR